MRFAIFFSSAGLVALLTTGCGGANTALFPGGSDSGTDATAPATMSPSGSGSDGGAGGDGGGPTTFGADAGGADAGTDTGSPLECGAGDKVCAAVCVAETDPAYGCSAASCAPCSLPNTAAVVCKAGACAIGTCPPGRADCDGLASNGCEADLTSDPTHCGSCVEACATSQVCSGGTCAATCANGLTDCGGACVDLTSNASHCGACATACSALPGATPSCTGGECSATCDSGYNLCSGSCVANGPASCGASCTACPTPANGTPTCSASGMCSVTCATGYTACGASCCSSAGQSYTDGTRLKATWLTTADGFREFDGWEDTQLATLCDHTLGADGQLRCLPVSPVSVSGSEFADSACTQLVGYMTATGNSCTAVPAYAIKQDTNPCAPEIHEYPVGAGVPAQHYSVVGGKCAPYTGENTGSYYAVGAEIAAASFVAASTTYGTAADGVAPLIEQSTDGSSGFLELDDLASKTRCGFIETSDGQLRCVPASDAINDPGYFSDSACQDPLFYIYPTTCAAMPPVGLITSLTANGCGVMADVYGIGSELANPPPSWEVTSGACTAATPSTGPSAFYAGGALLAPSSFGPASLSSPAAGSARIQEVDYVVGTSALRQPLSLYDSARAEPCSFTTAGDGALRCLPAGMPGSAQYFQDPACTQPVGVASENECASAPKYIWVTDETMCPARTQVMSAGAAITGTLYALLEPGFCSPASLTGGTAYAYGAEIAPTAFVEGTVTVP